MKNLTKILSMLLVVVMCVSICGGSAFAFGVDLEQVEGTQVVTITPTSIPTVAAKTGDMSEPNAATFGVNLDDSDDSEDPEESDLTKSTKDVKDTKDVKYSATAVVALNGEEFDTVQKMKDKYATLSTTTNTIEILADVSLDGILLNRGATISLGGKTLKVTSAIQSGSDGGNSASVTVNGPGNVTTYVSGPNPACNLAYLWGSSTISFNNVNITAENGIAEGTGKATISGGISQTSNDSLTSNVNIKSGKYTISGVTSPATPNAIVLDDGYEWKVDPDNAARWTPVAKSSTPTTPVVAKIGDAEYTDLDTAFGAGDGKTINIQKLNVAKNIPLTTTDTVGAGTTLNFDANEYVQAAKAIKIDGNFTINGIGTFAAASGITVKNGSTLTLSGGVTVSGNIVVDAGGTLIINGATTSGTIGNSGILQVSGTSNLNGDVTTKTNSELRMSGSDATVNKLIVADATARIIASGGTVKNSQFPAVSGTTNEGISGGTWQTVDNLTNFGKFLTPGYERLTNSGIVQLKSSSTSNTFKVTCDSSSGVYTYYKDPNSSKNVSPMTYTVTAPTNTDLDRADHYNVAAVGTDGSVRELPTAGNIQDLGSKSSRFSMTAATVSSLPADLYTLRFTFFNSSNTAISVNTDNSFCVYPYLVMTATNTTYVPGSGNLMTFTMSDKTPNSYKVTPSTTYSNPVSVSVDEVAASRGYDVTMTKESLENLHTNNPNASVFVLWVYYGDYKGSPVYYPVSRFYISSSGTAVTSTPAPTSTSDPFNPSSGGTIDIYCDEDIWYQGDARLKFRSNTTSGQVTSAEVDGHILSVMDYDARYTGYIYLGTDYLAGLKSGEHTLEIFDGKAKTSGWCTFRVGPTLKAKDTNKFVIGSSKNLKFVCSDPIYSIEIGGNSSGLVEGRTHEISNNGKTLTLYHEFLNERAASTYPYYLTVYTDNSGDVYATTTFYVMTTAQASASPRTGDNSDIALWAAVMALSGAAAVVIAPRLKKREGESE